MKTLLPILKTKLFLLGFVSTCTVILATTVPQIRNFIAPEKAIGEKITTEQKKIAPKIKKQNKTVISSRVTSGLSLDMNNSFTATVTADQDDYVPFSTATFTGAGFAPNEDILLKVKNLSRPCNTVAADSSYFPWTVTADDNGAFITTWTVCDCSGDSLRLRAVGEISHDTAYAYFTDGTITINSISPTTICTGALLTINYQTGNGGNSPSTPITAQLSDALGSFASPTNLTPTTSNTGNTPPALIVTIPAVPAGSGYLIRMVSPVVSPTSTSNTRPLTINASGTTTDAGADQTVCLTTATLAGNTATIGTGTWTVISGGGTVTIPGSPTSGVTNLGIGANVFRWTITNGTCSNFDEVTITRNQPPAITGQPAVTQTACSGGSVSFSVTATGTGLTYQWRKGTTNLTNGGNIAGATTATLTINPVATGDAAADYNVVVSGTAPCTPATSNNATLVVNQAVAITGQPATTQTTCSGNSVSFSVTATGTGLTYQWRKGAVNLTDGGSISGATTATLTINPVATGDAAANYNVVVSGTSPCTPLTSNNAALVVNQPPAITGQPAVTQTGCSGSSISFSVTATGTGLTYQWRKGTTNLVNGGSIAGATSATLTINPLVIGDAATDYNVVVSGTSPCTPATSNNAALVVNQAVAITGQPAVTQTTCSGNSVSFSVTATGTGLTYQWRKGITNLTDGGSISGATTATLTIDPVATGDAAANYNVVVSGTAPCTPQTSNNAALVVNQAVAITGQPAVTQTGCSGSSISFSVTATGTGLTYQWRKGTINLTNGGNISGATTATLTINPLAIGDAAANYNVVVSGTSPCTPATSNNAALVVNQAVAITGQPAVTQTVCSGGSVSFSVTATGTGLTYQWRKGAVNLTNGGSISGATSATLTINPVATGDAAANYNVVVSGTAPCTAVTSTNAALVVNTAPSISAQPADATRCVGTSVTFSVTASGTPSPTYQWRKNTVNIGVATSSSYTIPSVILSDADSYDVVVTNSCGSVTSDPATLTVNATTAITAQPTDATACVGGSASFTVVAVGANLTYQWQENTTGSNYADISGETSATLNFASVTLADADKYRCIVTGSCGTVTSTIVTLTVNQPPAITAQPAITQTVCSGSSVSFSVTATGTGLTYQWRKGTTNLTNGGSISGATSATLTINPVATGDAAADYNVVVSGTAPCTPATSNNAALVVNQAVAITGQPAVTQTTCSGSSVSFSVTATGTGLTYQWRKGTTNLTNGGNISGATTATLTIDPVATGDAAANYNVVVSGTAPCTPLTSSNATLVVNQAVAITGQPAVTQTGCSGSSISFSVTATGTGLTYQWRKGTTNLTNGGNISGATTATLTINPLAIGDAAANYNVVVSGTSPCTPVTSNDAALVVNQAVAITAQPATTQTVCSGSSVSFSVTATGTGLTYQWRKGTTNLTNGGSISGATTAILTIDPVATGDAAANYNVVVSGTAPCTPVTSNNAALVVNQAVAITGQPAVTQTGCSGSSVSFSVTATGTGLTYQWRKGAVNLTNGGNISGATTATLTINPLVTGDAATDYNVVVSGTAPCGSLTSNNAALVVNLAVSITAQPAASQTVCAGSAVNFSITPSGFGLSFQWRKGTTPLTDGGNISGANGPALTIDPVTAEDAAANYNVVVSGASPCTPVTSNNAALVVNQPPAITGQPAVTQTGCSGSSVSFSVTATGTGLTYQWRKGITNLSNGGNISGATTATLTINPLATGDAAADYNVVVSGAAPCGSVTSNNAALVVNQAVAITAQPATTQTTCSGNSVSFSVTATGTGLTYQWRKGTTNLTNGGSISGATTATLTIDPVATGDAAANYNVVVSGTAPCTPVTSNNAALVVNQAVAITAQPAVTQTACSGSSVSFSVTATGTGLTYQWKKGTTNLTNGGSISGATTATLTINPLATGDAAADYNVVVSGAAPCGSVTSNNAALVVNQAVAITGQPATTQTACSGSSVSFSVTATGTGLTYQWRKGTTNLTNGGNITGATTATLTINPVAAGDAVSNYNVVVSGISPCTPLTSNNAALVVRPLPTATIAINGANPICSGSTTTIKFMGPMNGTVTYNIDGGSDITGTINNGGNLIVTTAALTSNTTFNLVSVRYPDAPACDNPQSGSVTVIVDLTPPVISGVGGPQTISCPAAPSFSSPTASDAVSTGTLTFTFSDVTTPGTCTNAYSVTRTWTAKDACNNSSTASQTITVVDNTKPTVTAPTGSDLECAGDLPAAVTTIGAFNALPGASASDNCSATGSLTVTHNDVITTPGSCNGVITRTYTITDGCNNSQTVNQVFTVTDNTKPTVTAPNGADLECAGDLPIAVTTIGGFNALPGASASDNCTATGSLTVTHNDVVTIPGSCNGVITRTYTITDDCNNSRTVDQVFTVTDNTKPTVTAPNGADLECAGDLPIAVTTIGGFNALPGASASDNCTVTGSLTVTHNDVVTTPGSCNGVITRTYTITDDCNNSRTVDQVFTVTDNTKPTVTAPTGSDLECAGDLPVAVTTIGGFNALPGASASDNCTATGSLTVTHNDVVTTPGSCNGVITRTYTITDDCNNSRTVDQVFTVTDNTKPTVTAPTGSDLECAGDLPIAVTTIGGFNALPGASASDNCTATGSLTVSHNDVVTTPGSCNGVITRTYTITDDCNNSRTVDQVFTVTDNTKPTVTAPTGSDLECAGDLSAAVTTIGAFNALPGASASDNCTATGSLTVTHNDVVTTPGSCNGVITRTYTITDDCNNSRTVDQVFTVTDNTKPVLSAPNTVDLECSGDLPVAKTTMAGFLYLSGASASDNCSATGSLTVTHNDVVTIPGSCNGVITRTYTITDGCNNSQTVNQMFTVTDNTKPTLTAPNGADLECAGDLPIAVTTIGGFNALPGASASDNCTATGSLTVTHNDVVTIPGSCNGVITRTYTITDGCNNSQTVNQVFTVTDNTKPTVTAPTGSDLECAGDLPVAKTTIAGFLYLSGASASDNCTPTSSLTVTHNDVVTTPGSCNGVITRTYTITDDCNNSRTVDQVFTVTDNTKPTVTAPTGSDLECAGDLPIAVTTIGGFNALPGASASDNCTVTGSLTVTHNDVVTIPGSCNGVITRTYTITDDCNNSRTVDQVFTVSDNTKPTVTAPTGSDLECSGDLPVAKTTIAGFLYLSGASASDNCSATGSLTVTHNDVITTPGSCNGLITRTYTITDGCNNSQTVNQVFTVTDNTKPVLTAPNTVDLECSGDLPAAQTTIGGFNGLAGALASDNCTPTSSLTVSHNDVVTAPGSCNGVITRTYTITDDCNNSRTVDQVFTVTDNTKPVLSAPNTVDLECSGDLPVAKTTIAGFLYLSGASASDNCTPTSSLTVSHNDVVTIPGSCNGVITRTYTITDGCNNSQTVNQVFTVTDNTKPTVTAPTGSDLECAGDLPGAVTTIGGFNALPGASASDNCTPTSSLTVSHNDVVTIPGSCNGVITRTYTITDGCNNSQTVNQVFTVTDNTKPVLTAPNTVDLECSGDLPLAKTTISGFLYLSGASASDNCTPTSSLTVSSNDVVTTPGSCNGVITRTYTITDGCNNSQTVNQVFTVTDNTKPTVTAPTTVDLECAGDLPIAVTTIGTFNALPGASASDNCTVTGSLTVSHSDVVTTPGSCNGVITRTYTITDDCNNSRTVNQVFTVTDNTKPTVTAPTTVDLECNTNLPAAAATITQFLALNGATASDNCTAQGSLSVSSYTGTLMGGTCSGTITRRYTITDGCGNATTVNHVFTVTDNTAPTAICQNITVQLNSYGTVTITPSQINNGSNDNCGSVTLALDKTTFNCSNLGSNIVKLTVTDACNNTSTCSATLTVQDNLVPTILCPANITCGTDAGSCSKSLTSAQIGTPTVGDNCTSTTVTWTRSDGAATLIAPYQFGVTTITWKVTDGSANTATCSQTINVNKVNTLTTFTVSTTPSTNPVTQQYSDRVTFVATVTPFNCTGAGFIGSAPATGIVTFKIGTLVMGTAPIASDGTATLADVQLLEPSLNASLPPAGPLAPYPLAGATKTATAEFSGTDADYNVTNPNSASIKITQEDARINYIGDEIKATPNATTYTTTVLLKALITDISLPLTPPDGAYDPNAGDIRNARVMFVDRDNGNTPLSGWLTPILVTLDTRSGTVSQSISLTIPSNANSISKTIGIIIDNGYYYRSSSTDNEVVTIYLPVGDFITGGGYIIPTNSMGTMASDAGKKANFGFNVKFNKSGTNLQGNMNFIIRRTESDNMVHVYQFKANAMQSLGVNITNPNRATANFVSKCNVTDITNPNSTIALSGNKYMYVKMIDNGEPGAQDSISFAVANGTDDPAILANLIYSSNWITNQTLQMKLGGGNLVVHSGFNMNPTIVNNNTTITQSQQVDVVPVVLPFNVKVFPNPSQDQFSLYLEGANNDKVHIVVYDALGREVKKFEKEGGNIPVIFGRDLKGGAYFVEVRQGENHKTIKLIKQN